MTPAGFPHSDILGSRFVCQLPEAYRRLQRPSSAPSAKASTVCPYKLDHKDHTKRCSRPLCSSQATSGPWIPPAPAHPVGRERFIRTDHTAQPPTPTRRTEADRPEQPNGTCAPVPSGPNSVPSHPTTTPRFHPYPEGQTYYQTTPEDGHSRCSTLEHHLDTFGRGMGLDTRTPGAARCSLERR